MSGPPFRSALVTGGAGFIGTRLLPILQRRCRNIVVFDSLLPQVHGTAPVPPDFGADARFVQGDIRDGKAVEAVVRECSPDLVIHLAAETGTGQSYDEPARYCDVNVTGTAHLADALRRLPAERRRVVLASSRAVYGEGLYRDGSGQPVVPPARSAAAMAAGRFYPLDPAGRPLQPVATPETAPPAPASVYASTKLMQEFVLRQVLDATSIELVVLRFQNVYGAGQSVLNPYTGVLSIFSQLIESGRELDIYEDGLITRDFVHVSDVAGAIVAAARVATPPAHAVNVGSGRPATIGDVAGMMVRLHGRPDHTIRISGRFRSGDVRHAVADITRARELLGWRPEVSLEAGLEDLVSWVRAGAPPISTKHQPDGDQ